MSEVVRIDDDAAELLEEYSNNTGVRKKFLASQAIRNEINQRKDRLKGDTDN